MSISAQLKDAAKRLTQWREPSTPRCAFSHLSDAAWLSVLEASIKAPVQRGVTLPGFADAAIQTETVGSANKKTLREASNFYSFVRKTCGENAKHLVQHTRILDFGVSWGRIIRFFLKDTDAENLHGVDVSERYLDAARDSGCQAKLARIDPLGSLPYADASFDLVYAYSIFTHLPENVQNHWLAEIRRVLTPGGIFVATVEPPRFIDFFKAVNANDETLHPWHRLMAAKIAEAPQIRTRLEETGFSYIPGSETYGDTIMTPEYVRRHWGQFFEVLDFLDDPNRFWQAVVTARR